MMFKFLLPAAAAAFLMVPGAFAQTAPAPAPDKPCVGEHCKADKAHPGKAAPHAKAKPAVGKKTPGDKPADAKASEPAPK